MKYFRSCPRILTLAVAATFVLSGCVRSFTGPPRIVADASAVLTGDVQGSQAGGQLATYWFNYGTTPDYGSTTTTQTAVVYGQGRNGVSGLVDGLTAGTTYHYQLCSDVPDSLPPNCGADQVVTTTTGHDSVHGDGGFYSFYTQGCPPDTCYDAFSIVAAVDPSSSAIEGDLTFEGVFWMPTSGAHRIGASDASSASASPATSRWSASTQRSPTTSWTTHMRAVW